MTLNQQVKTSIEIVPKTFSIADKDHQIAITTRISTIVVEIYNVVMECNNAKVQAQLIQAMAILNKANIDGIIRVQISEVEKLK